MIRILHVLGGPLDKGGITTFILNYLSVLDQKKFSFSVLTQGNNDPDVCKVFNNLGCDIYNIPYKSDSLVGYFLGLHKFLNNGNFNIIHSHEDIMSFIPISYSRLVSRHSKIVMHSHNTDITNKTFLRPLIYQSLKKLNRIFDCTRLACSNDAGKWLFGKKCFSILENSINFSDYKFSFNKRQYVRNEMSLGDSYVIGYVGRIEDQKNPEFLLLLAKSLKKVSNKITIIAIGGGNKLGSLRNSNSNLFNLKFLGPRNDVKDILNAFDLFIMPSKFEGLGIAAIEAQANGLNCILSTNVPQEAKISDFVFFLPLDINTWVNTITDLFNNYSGRSSQINLSCTYNIEVSVNKLQKIYEDLIK